MNKKELIAYYDGLYSKRGSVFGEPAESVKRAVREIAPCLTLDFGAGDGRNALFAASEGFDVIAVDMCRTGLDKIEREAKGKRFRVFVQQADIVNYEWKIIFRMIICSYVLHHIRAARAENIIRRIQNHTARGGLNVLNAFTKDGDFFRQDPNSGLFFLDPGQLLRLYTGWEVIWYKEAPSKQVQITPGGSRAQNVSARIIARKL